MRISEESRRGLNTNGRERKLGQTDILILRLFPESDLGVESNMANMEVDYTFLNFKSQMSDF